MPRLTQHEVHAELARFEDDGNPNHIEAEQWQSIVTVDLYAMSYNNSLARFFLHAWENPAQAEPNGERITLAPYDPADYAPEAELESAFYTGQRKGSGYDPKADWDLIGKDGGR